MKEVDKHVNERELGSHTSLLLDVSKVLRLNGEGMYL